MNPNVNIHVIIDILENNSFTIIQDDVYVTIRDNITQDQSSITKDAVHNALSLANTKFYKELESSDLQSTYIYHKGIRYCANKLNRFKSLLKQPIDNNDIGKIPFEDWMLKNYTVRGSRYYDKDLPNNKGLTIYELKELYYN